MSGEGRIINPADRPRPAGFSHGILAPARSRLLFVAGQTAADASGIVEHREFAAQFDAALARVLAVVRAAGGQPHDIVRMTVYVTDLDAYRLARPALAEIWRTQMSSHYPAMALVEVSRLVDREAVVEIEATAAVPVAEERA